MAPKIIVSYDGTHNEDDAIALGRLLASAGAELALGYVRHAHDLSRGAEDVLQHEAEAALERGARLLDDPESIARHVVTDPSTPAGLRKLAEREGAEIIVFCSDSHTAPGHVTVGNSASRLIDNGEIAVAIAAAGLAGRAPGKLGRVAATGDDTGDSAAGETARAIGAGAGAEVGQLTDEGIDLLVIGSRAEAPIGQIEVSATAAYLMDVAKSSVLIVPRERPIAFGSHQLSDGSSGMRATRA